jgi:hypothetical protein
MTEKKVQPLFYADSYFQMKYLQAFHLQIDEQHHEFGLLLVQEKPLLNSKMQHHHPKYLYC